MKANIASYERLKLEADDMELKIHSLEEISRVFKDIVEKNTEMKLASYISKRIEYQLHLNRISEYQKGISANEERINEIDVLLKDIENNLAEFSSKKESLIGY